MTLYVVKRGAFFCAFFCDMAHFLLRGIEIYYLRTIIQNRFEIITNYRKHFYYCIFRSNFAVRWDE